MNPRTTLEALIANCDEVGECLEWRGPYGSGRSKVTPIIKCHVNGRSENLPVVRLVWEQTKGKIPPGKIVYRSCCNHRCIRCLKLGVRGDAHRQRKRLGLAGHSPSTIASLTTAARRRPTVKYTIEQARECRKLADGGLTDAQVSERTGVHVDIVCDIRRGKIWREHAPVASVFTWGQA